MTVGCTFVAEGVLSFTKKMLFDNTTVYRDLKVHALPPKLENFYLQEYIQAPKGTEKTSQLQFQS